MAEDRGAQARTRMVAEQLRARDVINPRVLEAISRVPRHLFVPADQRSEAYQDRPVPIGYGQTISQPYIVGFMTQELRVEPQHRVLEIGTGSGYQTAVLAELAAQVYSIELIPELEDRARRLLAELHYTNIQIRAGDGYRGWPEEAPFDRIIGTAAPERVPQVLVDQLAHEGILIIPVGLWDQDLHVLQKHGDAVETRTMLPVRFVPMVRRKP